MIFFKMFFGQVECSFENPADEIKSENQQMFGRCPKTIIKNLFLFQKNFASE